MVNIEGCLMREFTFMLGVSGLILITRVWTDDVNHIGKMNYLYSKSTLEDRPVLAGS